MDGDNKKVSSGKWAMTLRTRLLLLVLIALLPTLVVIVETAVGHYRHQIQDAQDDVLKIARLAVRLHEGHIDEARQVLNLMAEIPQIRELDPQACEQFLKDLLFGNLHYANLGVIRPDGTVMCSAVPSDRPINLADRPYFQNALKTKRLSVGDYQIGRFVNKPVQVVAMPFLNAEKQVQVVGYAALKLDGLMQFSPLSELPPGSAITVADRHGVILSRAPDPEGKWTGVSLENTAPFAMEFIRSNEDKRIQEAYGVDGFHRIYALARLGSVQNTYGYVIIGTPSSELYATLKSEVVPRVAFVLVAFLAILLIARFGGEMLVLRRMRTLSSAVRKVGEGDLGARAMVGGKDEIAQLAGEFNKMGETLQKNDQQIHRLNRIHEVLSSINGAILRIRDRNALTGEACQIAVERGGLKFAWIGLIDAETGKINKIASHGGGEGFLHDHCLATHTDLNDKRCPCTIAIPEDRPVIHNHIGGEEDSAPWHAQAYAHGFRSIAGFPLRRDGKVVGVLGLYAGDLGFFDTLETDLFVELAADISLGLEYIDKDQRISHMLYHDALTGLPNRKLCEDRLHQAIAQSRRHHHFVGVIVLNVTGFRRVVGVYGHHIADETLNLIAMHLVSHIREGDTVARLEGDEFAIILADVATPQDVIRLAQTLIASIPSSLTCSGKEIHLVMRGGVAISPSDGKDAESLLRSAKLACTGGKEAGHHTVNFYSTDIQQTARDREQFEQALRHAIEGGSELELHYQPVVDIATRRIISLEALTRWNSQDFGPVSPARFIPVAEETGLIMPLGDWVLNTAVRQVDAWQRSGFNDIRVAINVSFRQLRKPDFIDRLCEAVQGTHNQLAIELTESELMNNIETTIYQLGLLKNKNFTIYIDDFGTGYSSLSYLQRLPVDVLKIDQSFISMLGKTEGSEAIVRSVIALAHSLRLKAIAEGVETKEQLALLQSLGCDYAQGYLFSRPRPAEEISRMLEEGGLLT